MIIYQSKIKGLYQIQPEPHLDERGQFARLYCHDEFKAADITFSAQQVSLSRSHLKYTLRGMHWQNSPYAEVKIVRYTQGEVFDVVADIRPDSETFGQWVSFILSARQANSIYIPKGCAHGFMTLSDNCDVLYHMESIFVPGQACGFRYDDPAFKINWPHDPSIMNQADKTWSDFTDTFK